MFKVIIAGSRGVSSSEQFDFVSKKLSFLFQNHDSKSIEIVSGGARGADKLGEKFAKANNYAIKQFLPDWNKLGRKAGYVRNDTMAKYADACVVFWDGKSKGSSHMITLANRQGLETRVYTMDTIAKAEHQLQQDHWAHQQDQDDQWVNSQLSLI